MSGRPFNIAAFLGSGVIIKGWKWSSSHRRQKKPETAPVVQDFDIPATEAVTTETVNVYCAEIGYATATGSEPPAMVAFKHEDFVEARAVIDELVAASKAMCAEVNDAEGSRAMWERITKALAPFELPPW